MRIVRSLPCVANEFGACAGHVQADHAGRRGLGQKCHDRDVISICEHHHRQRADFAGPFKRWTQQQMREWLASKIALTQQLAIGKGAIVP